MEGPIEFDKVIMVARDCLLAKNELMVWDYSKRVLISVAVAKRKTVENGAPSFYVP